MNSWKTGISQFWWIKILQKIASFVRHFISKLKKKKKISIVHPEIRILIWVIQTQRDIRSMFNTDPRIKEGKARIDQNRVPVEILKENKDP